MAYPLQLTSVLSGVTPSQLHRWRATGLVVPEIKPYRPPLYSYRDLMLLRTMAYLRAETAAERVATAFNNLDFFHLTDHPSEYEFGTDGKTIYVEHEGKALDLVRRPGDITLMSFTEVLESFSNFRNDTVPPLTRPADGIVVRPQRLSGWPTVEDTRVPYDTIAGLVDFRTVFPEDVPDFYPSVSPLQAEQAVAFDKTVSTVAA